LQGGAAVTGSAVTSAPVPPLTIGSRGTQVTALQNWLLGQGYQIPAGATGYFGAQTQAAVKAFQVNKSIMPTAGYYGNLTAAAVAEIINTAGGGGAGTGTVGNLCPNGNTLASNCATAPVTTPATGALCPNGMTLASNCTSTGTVSAPSEGSITASLASTPVPDQDIRSTTNVPVWGMEIDAVGSDMTVDRVDLEIAVTPVGGSANNPGAFVKKIAFYDGSTLLKEMAVSSSDFTKDTSDRYHVIVTALALRSRGTPQRF